MHPPRLGGTAFGLTLFLAGAAGTWMIWRYFVETTTGQQLDNTAFRGSSIGRGTLWQWAEPVLNVVSVPFVIAVLGTTAVIALLRRRWLLAIQAIVLVVGANLTTQLLKHVIWDRPALAEPAGAVSNSLPSGHTTVAASAAAVLLLTVPRANRPWVTLLAAGYAALTGVSTMIGGWHRPSDVAAAMTVVLAWAGMTTMVTAYTAPDPSEGSDRSRTPIALVAALLALGSLLTGAVAFSALLRTRDALAAESWLTGRSELATAYAGGALGVVAIVALVFAAIVLAHHVASYPGRWHRSTPVSLAGRRR